MIEYYLGGSINRGHTHSHAANRGKEHLFEIFYCCKSRMQKVKMVICTADFLVELLKT